jgi:hypothetical protein
MAAMRTNGTVFKVNTDGTDFTNLHNFTAGALNGGSELYQQRRSQPGMAA